MLQRVKSPRRESRAALLKDLLANAQHPQSYKNDNVIQCRLAPEISPFGIRTMLVEPGFFRTELLTPESTSYAEPTIDDYAEKTKQTLQEQFAEAERNREAADKAAIAKSAAEKLADQNAAPDKPAPSP